MEIRKLNTLRGLAALIVVVSHFSNSTNWLGSILGKGAGQFGVMLFFMLSGFLMSYLYMDKAVNYSSIKKYAVARVARVAPLFLSVVVFSYINNAYGLGFFAYRIMDVEMFISHILLLNGVSVLWTIPTEMHFYVLFAFMWWLFSRQDTYLYVFIAALVVVVFFAGFPHFSGKVGDITYSLLLPRSLPYFMVGVVLGRIYSRWTAPQHATGAFYILTLALIPLLYPKIFSVVTGFNHGMWSDLGILIIMSMVFFSIVFLVPDDNPIISNRVGDFFGKISFSLYLLHIPVLLQVKQILHGYPGVQLLLVITIASVVSYISYRLIEAPAARFIRKAASKNGFGLSSLFRRLLAKDAAR